MASRKGQYPIQAGAGSDSRGLPGLKKLGAIDALQQHADVSLVAAFRGLPATVALKRAERYEADAQRARERMARMAERTQAAPAEEYRFVPEKVTHLRWSSAPRSHRPIAAFVLPEAGIEDMHLWCKAFANNKRNANRVLTWRGARVLFGALRFPERMEIAQKVLKKRLARGLAC